MWREPEPFHELRFHSNESRNVLGTPQDSGRTHGPLDIFTVHGATCPAAVQRIPIDLPFLLFHWWSF